MRHIISSIRGFFCMMHSIIFIFSYSKQMTIQTTFYIKIIITLRFKNYERER